MWMYNIGRPIKVLVVDGYWTTPLDVLDAHGDTIILHTWPILNKIGCTYVKVITHLGAVRSCEGLVHVVILQYLKFSHFY